jgi:Mg-chelatase subunit ChlD
VFFNDKALFNEDRRALPSARENGLVDFDLRPQRDQRENVQQTTLVVEGLYRGRKRTLSAPVFLYNRPDVTALRHELERGGMVAVQASDDVYKQFAGKIEVVIVLDCSGSMNSKVDGNVTRINRVRDAISAALRQMPRGVFVSLYAFSQDGNEKGLKCVIKRQELEPDRVSRLMEPVNELIPKYRTPLIHSIGDGASEFSRENKLSSDAGISKTLVVLTDGVDNEFPDRREATKVLAYLKDKVGDKGIQLNVLAVDVDVNTDPDLKEDEREDARITLRNFEAGVKAVGGNYRKIKSKDRDELVVQLASALAKPRYFVFEQTGRVPVDTVPEDGVDISRLQENPIWIGGLKRGFYRIFIKTNQFYKAAEQLIYLEDGDSLLLELKNTPAGLRFMRQVYLDTDKIRKEHLRGDVHLIEKPRPPWKVGVVQNQRVFNPDSARRLDSLNAMAVLEQAVGDPGPDGVLKLNRPGLAWFSLRSRDAEGNISPELVRGLRFYPINRYPSPSYALDVPDWPEKDRSALRNPVLDAYWLDPAENLNKLLFATVLNKRNNDLKPGELPKKFPVVALEGEKPEYVVLESLKWEKRRVEEAFGKTKEQMCLVVRLRFPPGKPFFSVPTSTTLRSGFEHRLYLDAGKYTGIFWADALEQLSDLETLQLVSLLEFQRRAITKEDPKENWILPEPDRKKRPDEPRAEGIVPRR